jgi:hypothetical protein
MHTLCNWDSLSSSFSTRKILITLFATVHLSCWNPNSGSNVNIHFVKFPIPTKDDVLSVDGRRLSLSGYNALRNHLPGNLAKDQVLWIATAALALQNDARLQGKEILLPHAVSMAQKALTDLVTRNKLENLITQSVIQRNPQVLAEIR